MAIRSLVCAWDAICDLPGLTWWNGCERATSKEFSCNSTYCKDTMSRMATEMGRPPKPPSQRRSVLLNFRLTRVEYRTLAKKAKSAGLSVSEYLRKLIKGGKA